MDNGQNGNGNNGGNGEVKVFKQHHQEMLSFRKTHAAVRMVNAPRLTDSEWYGGMNSLVLSPALKENGGTRESAGDAFGDNVLPIVRVAEYRIGLN